MSSKHPDEFIKGVAGNQVVVKLNNATEYRGNLLCLDGFMNIVLQNPKEYLNGKLVTTHNSKCFLRGNNVLYISEAENQ